MRTIMLIDHDLLFGAGLSALLAETGLLVAPVVASLAAALTELEAGSTPAVIILDPAGISDPLPVADQIARLRKAAPEAGLVVLTGALDGDILCACQESAADACLSKAMPLEAVRRTLHLVMLGQRVLPAAALSTTATESPGPADEPGRGPDLLTVREREILSCLLGGGSNKDIASRLNVAESTVKMHFKALLRKLRVQNRTQAAMWALSNGIEPRL
ncbi:LuxR C-terminal-related transcriptional regulator [Rhodospirillum centenum]|uniref:Transcriptional regulator, LuxR family protein n=1 Tax=Rhodospirillum centenum (strain ATCC 51521 / SW) TaxID=414684 RepID=B6IS42_RHOCS|nr:response regulator transcription factor [Rhodospirillum centenum]ACI98278.1 transcriptional regulator, LuxR family protein [Rhodospirillum centenum SW]